MAATLTVKGAPLISQFYIAHPASGKREGEEQKKLIFYHPKTDSVDVQTQNVGFAEAVVKFTDSFSPTEDAVTAGASNAAVRPTPYHEVITKNTVQVG